MTDGKDEGTPRIFELISKGDQAGLEALVREEPAAARARSPEGVSALMTALYHRREEMASTLIAAGAEIDVFEAASLGRTDLLNEHLDRDTDAIRSRSADGFTPLHFACFFGHAEPAKALLDRGAPVDVVAENPSRVLPIHSAAAGRNVEIVAALIEKGADPDARQHGGWTALHAAAMHGLTAMARVLIEAGARTTINADDGRTARDMAEEQGDAGLVALFDA